ncbi:hypothetical protein lerEdw1_004050 [Lerista edwardsae]|nr:hypothetical protein lerEdw1_004054 [Lerista edwardsae]KAJ6650771.1 hypothetical protein lerEdw1_004050 [Lerista edwardsae]
MRKSFKAAKQKEEQDTSSLSSESTSLSDHTETSLFQDEDWEQEAVKLYDWSRTLRTEDIGEGL